MERVPEYTTQVEVLLHYRNFTQAKVKVLVNIIFKKNIIRKYKKTYLYIKEKRKSAKMYWGGVIYDVTVKFKNTFERQKMSTYTLVQQRHGTKPYLPSPIDTLCSLCIQLISYKLEIYNGLPQCSFTGINHKRDKTMKIKQK